MDLDGCLLLGTGSGSKVGGPTYATMRWTAMWSLGTGTRLPCTGRGTSPVRTGSSHTLSSWTRFAR